MESSDDKGSLEEEVERKGEEMETSIAVITISSIVISLILTIWMYSIGEPLLGLVVLVVGIGLPIVSTEQGREMLNEVKSEYDEGKSSSYSQQQSSSPSVSKQICNSCGWQNDSSFTYCNDCGSKLGGGE